MFPHSVFVIHSPYPDGTWRGLEKCGRWSSYPDLDAPILFTSREVAEDYVSKHKLLEFEFRIVEVTLVTPAVRDPLDSATQEKLDNLLPR
jgi:hypothetical protein